MRRKLWIHAFAAVAFLGLSQATPATAANAPAPDSTLCESLLSRARAYFKSEPVQYEKFRSARSLYRRLLSAHASADGGEKELKIAPPRSPEEKVALLFEALIAIEVSDLSFPPKASGALEKVIRTAHVKRGKMGVLEARRILRAILEHCDPHQRAQRSWVGRIFGVDWNREVAQELGRRFLKSDGVDELFGELTRAGAMRPEGLIDTARILKEDFGRVGPWARLVLYDAALVYLGLWPVALTNLNFLSFMGMEADWSESLETGETREASRLARESLKKPAILQASLRKARWVAGVGVTAAIIYLVPGNMPVIQTVGSVATTTESQERAYEQANDSPAHRVEEQLSMWLDARDGVATDEEKEAKRQELWQQESSGLLRIHPR